MMFNKKKIIMPAMPVDNVGLYSIYDKVGNEFASPWTAKNDEVAMRTYLGQIAQAKKQAEDTAKQIGYNPFSEGDFQLYYLGTIDIANGTIVSDIRPVDSF